MMVVAAASEHATIKFAEGKRNSVNPGYIYVLSNESMPGIIKVGRTERQPEVRSRELQTTGVPNPFKLEHFVFVDDCHSAEQEVHALLEANGLRTASNREFFTADVGEAIKAVELVTQLNSPESPPDFGAGRVLAALALAIPRPLGSEQIHRDEAERLAERLAQIGRKGFPPALMWSAEIFEINSPSSYLFKLYWREFLTLARAEASLRPLASGGQALRQEVGKNVAEYLYRCNAKGWLQEDDFVFVSEFLLAGDQFQYEGYIEQIRRDKLPAAIMRRAEEV